MTAWASPPQSPFYIPPQTPDIPLPYIPALPYTNDFVKVSALYVTLVVAIGTNLPLHYFFSLFNDIINYCMNSIALLRCYLNVSGRSLESLKSHSGP